MTTDTRDGFLSEEIVRKAAREADPVSWRHWDMVESQTTAECKHQSCDRIRAALRAILPDWCEYAAKVAEQFDSPNVSHDYDHGAYNTAHAIASALRAIPEKEGER